MLVLTVYQSQQKISYKIFKLFNKKNSLQRRGKISWHENNIANWIIYNAQNKQLQNQAFKLPLNADGMLDYNKIVTDDNFTSYNFDLIVHKIACGGREFEDITLLNPLVLEQLQHYTFLAPKKQAADISLARAYLDNYSQTKHYACFDTGFHQNIPLKHRIISLASNHITRGIQNHGNLGLVFAGISAKFVDLSDKKTAKGRWIIAFLQDDLNVCCAIKNGKSHYCSSSALHNELPSVEVAGYGDLKLAHKINDNSVEEANLLTICDQQFNSLDEIISSTETNAKLALDYYINQISDNIIKLANVIQGIDGIVFTGKIGLNNAQLRQLICNKLEWLGVSISNKANLENQCKLHKKNSKISVFTMLAEPESAMLQQLAKRID
ncbi:MAG: hypothetical protein K2X04_07090 [Burkholderiales bacterium]|nr:hypothetical protein [Burkholderiales bacterium]